MAEPTKAYIIEYVVGVRMQAIVHAASADEAIEAMHRDDLAESTGSTYRVTKPKARRWHESDLDPLGDQNESGGER